ncbi:hypothetical protein D1115_15555 [Vibrio alfacsensis]|uniref:Uncharacterized protein n=1 Tax=Vibrio alfacsensis TaxID=1074311 RepID=A0ABM6YX67_9VIBR|nr:hypothetical protein D1115_15555 [Vibrio alfacsensis]
MLSFIVVLFVVYFRDANLESKVKSVNKRIERLFDSDCDGVYFKNERFVTFCFRVVSKLRLIESVLSKLNGDHLK